MNKTTQLAIAAVLGAGALIMNKWYLDQRISEVSPKNFVEVAVAANQIAAGSKVSPQQVKIAKVPKGYAPLSAVKKVDLESFIGQEIGVDVPKGDYLMEGFFPSEGRTFVGNKLSDQVDNDQFRALTLPVDETNSLARSIVPGDHIDLQFTVQVPGTGDKASFLFLQDVPVLATGSFSSAEAEGRAANKRYATITVLLPLQDSLRLSFARQSGQINILLRGSRRGAETTQLDVPPISGLKDILTESQRQTMEGMMARNAQAATPNMSDRVKGQLRELLERERSQQGK